MTKMKSVDKRIYYAHTREMMSHADWEDNERKKYKSKNAEVVLNCTISKLYKRMARRGY
jgi:broad-specificity NMP kinase